MAFRALPLGALCALSIAIRFAGQAAAQPASGEEPEASAVVVLIGDANHSPELAVVLSELLLRRGVQPQFMAKPRFEPSALLDAAEGDARVWVFVAPEGVDRARLYFRGPFGERFMLRELALRAGLDEVGRELIARVVETATVALLHSAEGMSRKEAEAAVAEVGGGGGSGTGTGTGAGTGAGPEQEPEQEPEPEPEPEPGLEPEPESVSPPWLLGVHLTGQLTGPALGPRYGAGLDLGYTLLRDASLRLRVRAAFEASLSQTLEHATVEASVMSWPIRLGIDIGFATDRHALLLGVAGGIDLVWTSPESVSDSTLTLSEPRTQALPAARAELRYEIAFSPVLLSLVLLADVPLADTHYDVMQDGSRARIASPWRVRPGIALGCGARL